MRRRALAFAAAILAAACGLDALGTLAPNEEIADGGVTDTTNPDRAPDEDAAATDADVGDSETTDGGLDADADADADAHVGCDAGPVTVVDTFGTLDGGTWFRVFDGSNVPYPKATASSDGVGASLVNPTAGSSLGALWLSTAVPLHAFDVSFRYVMPCDSGTCSDGLAVAWLEETDAGLAAVNGYVVAKASFGLPQALRGAAVAFDLRQDTITGDPAAPYLSLLALDGSVPGQYAWHTKTTPRANTAGTHAVALRLRQGSIEVRVDGALVQTGAVASRFKGWFGFGASSGDTTGTFLVRDFAATFYRCDDP